MFSFTYIFAALKRELPNSLTPVLFIFVALVVLGLSATTQAAIFTWDGGGSGTRWDTAGNWVGDPTWVKNSADTQVIFHAPGAADLTSRVGEFYTIGSLEFNTNATNAVHIELRNNNGANRTLTLGNATVAPTITVQSSGNVTHVLGSDSRGSVVLGNDLTVAIDGTTGTKFAISRPITESSSGSYGIIKQGTGLLNLNAVNSYSGGTTLSAGTLALGSGGSIDDSSSIEIGAGAEFDVTSLSSYAMLSTQPFTFDLDPAGGGSAGLLDATGTILDIANGNVSFNPLDTLDDPFYVLANYGSLTGTQFASVTAPAGYTIDYNYLNGNQIALTAAAVPEPSTFALAALGLFGLAFFGWRKKK